MKFIRSTAALIAAMLLFSPLSLASAQAEPLPVSEMATTSEQQPKNNEAGSSRSLRSPCFQAALSI